MKKYLLRFNLLILIISQQIIHSQSLDIYLNNGDIYNFSISNIDSITFTTENGGGETGEPCPGIPTVDYAGKVYHTVQIGNQCWLKENLNIGTMINENVNPEDNNTIEKYCYENNISFCNDYGGLYNWDEAMQYRINEGAQGICPDGWHIPAEGEWQILRDYVNNEATKLIDENARLGYTYTNETGFSAFFTGFLKRGYAQPFVGFNTTSFFWSSTLYNDPGDIELHAYSISFGYDNNNVFVEDVRGAYGMSVRCIKN